MKIPKQIILLSILLLLYNVSKAQTSSDSVKKRIKWKDVVVKKYDPSENYAVKYGKDCLEGEDIIHTKYMTGSIADLTKREIKKIKKRSAKNFGKIVFVDTRQNQYEAYGLQSVYYLWISCSDKEI